MGNMIDRLAGFIAKRHKRNVTPEIEARLTLELLREPSYEMLDAGADGVGADAWSAAQCTGQEGATGVWQAMIDAA